MLCHEIKKNDSRHNSELWVMPPPKTALVQLKQDNLYQAEQQERSSKFSEFPYGSLEYPKEYSLITKVLVIDALVQI